MQTTFKDQIEAIAKAMTSRARKVKARGNKAAEDAQWKALNDAASTIAAVQLAPSPEWVALQAKKDTLI